MSCVVIQLYNNMHVLKFIYLSYTPHMIDKLIEILRRSEMEINVEKTKVMRISS
jgi:hypothetical protein